MKIKTVIFVIFMMLFSVSCEWDDVDEANERNNSTLPNGDDIEITDSLPEIKVAVVLPLDNSYRPRFERIAKWALDNIKIATKGIEFKVSPTDLSGIKINIEWFDENVIDAEVLAKELSLRQDISAIIGPMYSSDAQIFALECAKTEMNILLPCTTSSEVVRKFSNKPWFWSFAETDIRQCQVMLEIAKNYCNCNSISLIASNSFYGQTFMNWLPFQCHENGLKFIQSVPYDGDLDRATAEKVMEQSVDGQVILCSPGEVSDILTIQNAVKSKNPKGKVIFSDIAMDPSLLDYGTLFDNSLGIGITADEKSNFLNEYISKYATEPTEGEFQFYDALVLMSLVAADLYNQGFLDAKTENIKNLSIENFYNKKVSDALTRILKPETIDELFLTKWEDIKKIVQNQVYSIRGASGHLDFDKQNNSTVAHSTYQLWTIKDRGFSTIKSIAETPMSIDAWEQEVTKIEEIPTSDVDITYPSLDDKWALLISGSNQWVDYRYQANVLNVYNLLKKQGYPDDHIILIMDDNISNNPNNIHKGMILSYDGVNLYNNVEVDYKLSSLSISDITKILTGQNSEQLPNVINADNDDNIFVYWTGNGSENKLSFDKSYLTNQDFLNLMTEMSQGSKKYRKMLWMVDASNAQSVTQIPENQNIEGVLCVNSSSNKETSLADQCDFDETMAIYLSTRFSKILVEELTKSPNDTYYKIYETLAKYTSGSHVNISNSKNFDNLKSGTISEFVKY
ncbi:MAG: hypothetical protein MJ211_01310 [Bacteroidales bacterium]|nr:hypothetical protein [Bacteroidales bacterium]